MSRKLDYFICSNHVDKHCLFLAIQSITNWSVLPMVEAWSFSNLFTFTLGSVFSASFAFAASVTSSLRTPRAMTMTRYDPIKVDFLISNAHLCLQISFASSCLTVIHGLLAQGSPDEPSRFSSRIIFLIMFFTGVLLVASYSASLTSMLAIKTTVLPFLDRKTLLASNYKVAIVKGTSMEDNYKVSP